jgi:5-methylcytosine-specific restriction endonuclease McrA
MSNTRNKNSHPASNGGKWIRPDKRLAIYLRDGQVCIWCGHSLEDGAELTLDHLVPCELGGDNHESNLVTACRHCNCSRRDLTVRQWLVVLRDRGIDTNGLAATVRRHTRRNLKKFRAMARQIIKARA